MKNRSTALVIMLLAAMLGVCAIAYAAGSTDMPGNYSAPAQKDSQSISQFIDSLNAMTPAEQQKAIDKLLATPGASSETIRINTFAIEGDDPLHIDANELLHSFVHKRLTVDQLNGLVELLTNYYHQHDYPVAVVYLPQQEIKGGNVRFALLIGKYGEIKINNKTVVSDAAILRQTYAIKSGDYITSTGLEKALLLANDLAMADAKAELSPGKEVGTADLTINATPDDSQKYGGNASFDNVGSVSTGQYEFGLGLYSNNLTRNADNIALSGSFGYQPHDAAVDTWNGAVSYTLPTGLLHGNIGASVSYVNYYIGGDFYNLQDQGHSLIGSLNWSYALQRSQLENKNVQIRLNAKNLKDTQGSVGTWTASQVYEAGITYGGNSITRTAYTGLTTYNLGLTAGVWYPDGQTNYVARQNTTPAFAYVNGEFYHKAYLTEQWSADVDFTGQVAPCNLNPTDNFSLGGYSGVKAFAQGYAAGTNGALGKLNIRYNIPWKPQASWWPEWQVIGFADAGAVQILVNQIPGVPLNNQAIGDCGLGISMYSNSGFNLEVDYATQLFYWDNLGNPNTAPGEGNNNFMVHLNYSF